MDDKEAPPFPMAYDVEAGKTYYWCSCKESQTQPFCDRQCATAVAYTARLNETLYFCACKETRDPPFCDGSHARLLFEFMKNKGKLHD